MHSGRMIPSTAVTVCWEGVSAQRGCLPGGVCPRGVSAWGGVHLLPWTEFLTHACENITFRQLRLRMVNINFDSNGSNHLEFSVSLIKSWSLMKCSWSDVVHYPVVLLPYYLNTTFCIGDIYFASFT